MVELLMLQLLTEVENIIQVLRLEFYINMELVLVLLFVQLLKDGQVIDAIVTNPGIGYSSISTEVRAFPRGSGGKYAARVRSLTLNNTHRFGDSFLSTKEDTLRV